MSAGIDRLYIIDVQCSLVYWCKVMCIFLHYKMSLLDIDDQLCNTELEYNQDLDLQYLQVDNYKLRCG